MNKIISTVLLVSLIMLSACGSNRDSNDPANPETQMDSQGQNLPNTGNEEVNEENDLGIPDTGDDMNDPTFEKPKE
ncbi:hypothetical protein [Psychrobacillus lasiicapitis]|uniref:Lipoprotein n=1 Tax=Psychrobacillus lasiicapitis TaxID=1636719 RepID=A0A544TH46_9BACI|nr:hypothetical protein [Psychrobacillus lasiicapitis]TQR16779.1 hypothetical protein FG382_01060 [Psychrobacillus lasiicapitis]GGA27272.1 hypothetical protein GCM10011384_15740 [Psychrobacillus lasiicapitis]